MYATLLAEIVQSITLQPVERDALIALVEPQRLKCWKTLVQADVLVPEMTFVVQGC